MDTMLVLRSLILTNIIVHLFKQVGLITNWAEVELFRWFDVQTVRFSCIFNCYASATKATPCYCQYVYVPCIHQPVALTCCPDVSQDSCKGNSNTATDCSLRNEESPWWHHQMQTFSTLLALCAGNSPVTGEIPSQRPGLFTFVSMK